METASLIISIISTLIAVIAIVIAGKNARPWLSLEIERGDPKININNGIKLILKNIGQSPLTIQWERSRFFKGKFFYLTFEGNQATNTLNVPNNQTQKKLMLFPRTSTKVCLNLYSCDDHVVFSHMRVGLSEENAESIFEEIKNIDLTIFYSWPTLLFRYLKFNTKLIFTIHQNYIDSCETVSTR